MPTQELLTRWTVRAALLLYALSLALRLAPAGRASRPDWAQQCWVWGCFAFWLHLACAFQFYHHWSHHDAYEATARQTAEVVGLAWGGGLYANYAFAALWTADACWWCCCPDSYRARPRGLEWAVQGFLGFIAFNATVTFGVGPIRWLGLAACLVLATLLVSTKLMRKRGEVTGPEREGGSPPRGDPPG